MLIVDIYELPDLDVRCETFCKACGQLRLWCRPDEPTACGNCGTPSPMVGPPGGGELERMRNQWHSRAGN